MGKKAGIACTLPSVFFGGPQYGAVDWFTHILGAVGLGIALRARRPTILAAAFGAMAPDLDALFVPLTITFPNLWFLDHRTFSHSLILGLPWAYAVTWVIQRPAVLAVWRRLFRVDIALPMGRAVLAPMFAGVVLHIAMDAMTVQGPALLSPLSAERLQLNWFYYVDLAPLAVSTPAIALSLWRLGTARQRRAIVAALVVAVLATGAWRGVELASVRAAAPGSEAVPTWNPRDWWTWRVDANGTVEIQFEVVGRGTVFRSYVPLFSVHGTGNPDPALARSRAEGTMDYTAFAMNAYVIALNATLEPSGAWRLGYFDPVRRAEAVYTGLENVFSPEDLVLTVAPDGSVTAAWP